MAKRGRPKTKKESNLNKNLDSNNNSCNCDHNKENAYDGFKNVVKEYTESKKIILRDSSRSVGHIEQLGVAFLKLVKEYIFNGTVPSSEAPTKEDIENSIAPYNNRKRPE